MKEVFHIYQKDKLIKIKGLAEMIDYAKDVIKDFDENKCMFQDINIVLPNYFTNEAVWACQ